MDIFFILFFKLLPLYVIILLGYLAGKLAHAKKETIATLLIYLVAPVVVCYNAATTPLDTGTLALPFLFFLIPSVLCIFIYYIAGVLWKDSTRNILSFAAATGNVGYFGLPASIAILGDKAQGLVIMCVLGIILFENSVGFFFTARGHHTARESLIKLSKLPALYAYILGLIINMSHVTFTQSIVDTSVMFRGTYTVLGMILIGLAISEQKRLAFEGKFLSFLFLFKFLIWPMIAISVIAMDVYLFHIFSDMIHKVIFLLSIVPVGANSVAFATELKAQPEKTAVGVLLSTLFALVYIPLIAVYFLK